MNIRAQLLSRLLPVFLGGLVLVAVVGYSLSHQMYTQQVLNHLESVASTQSNRINAIVEQNRERVRLVASRTQLRLSLKRYLVEGGVDDQAKMHKIIRDALLSIPSFNSIVIVSPTGQVVASTRASLLGVDLSLDRAFLKGLMDYQASTFVSVMAGKVVARMSGPLRIKGKIIGTVIIEAGIDNIADAIGDHSGLGLTGETLLALETKEGDALFLTPLRFDPDAALTRRVKNSQYDAPMIKAITGRNQKFSTAYDYRGEQVFAVTSSVESTSWGIVVKQDRAEALNPLYDITMTIVVMMLLVALIVSTATVFFAHGLTQPLRRLTGIANEMRQGKLREAAISMASADDDGRGASDSDEVQTLSGAFGQMIVHLDETSDDLRLKVLELRNEVQVRKLAENIADEGLKRYETVLRSMVDAFITIDPEGRIESFNPAAEHMFGYSAVEAVGEYLSMLLPQSEVQEPREYLVRLHFIGLSRTQGSNDGIIGRRKDGSLFPIELTLSTMMQNGEQRYIGILRDITERLETDRVKGEFVAIVSHELRTPLTSIKGSLGLVLGGVVGTLAPKMRELLAVSMKNVDRLAVLVDDLLDMEKLQAGRMSLHREEQQVGDLVSKALIANRGYANEHGVTLLLSKDTNPGMRVRADESRIQQVLSNLLSNAIKFSPVGASVDVCITHYGRWARISVKDQGPGIPEAFRDRIFQKFMQANSSDSRGTAGTGLGLAISRQIVELHHGQIGFDSTEGRGAEFYVDLPLIP